MARACRRLADETAAGKLVAVLEGGYDLDAIDEGVATVLDVFRGGGAPARPITGDARRADGVLARVRAAQQPFWSV
jgi:acetoin utilization deacetylase AcuC-like enzyme